VFSLKHLRAGASHLDLMQKRSLCLFRPNLQFYSKN